MSGSRSEVSPEILRSVSTPDRVESRLGLLEFVDLSDGPGAPDGKINNWLQTIPGRGSWTILRLYNPLQPFFDKPWRPSEIEPN
jgi:hypothetical protein